MITLITGLPGNGKTLYALQWVKEKAERENRPVFYSGISELKLPWTEIEPEKWMDCPPGSIIVIDECQRVFRPRTASKAPPDFVARLETHRHDGLDIVLITQHPMLADNAVRRLSGQHFHVIRKWGTQSATVHEWPSVRENCDKSPARKDSIKHAWKYPKAVYEYYRSAELHTVKRNIPMRLWFVLSVPLFIGAAVWYVYGFATKKPPIANNGVTGAVSAPVQQSTSAAVAKANYQNSVADAKQFVYERQERVTGLSHTAPRYDEVTKPVSAPRPAACVASKSKCNCYSQQATLLAVPEQLCREIVQRGYYIDFDDGSGKLAHNEPEKASSGVVVRPDSYKVQM